MYSQILPSFDRTIKFELQELSLAKRSFGILVMAFKNARQRG